MAGRVMDWFSRLRNWRFRSVKKDDNVTRGTSQQEHIARALSPMEPYVIKVQTILIWDNPLISMLSIVFVNILFGLAVSFEIRFYGLIFTALLCIFICDMWIETIWPQISVMTHHTTQGERENVNPRLLSIPEISSYLTQAQDVLKNYYNWLKYLREDQPGTFCFAMCLLFGFLTFIGREIPGTVIGYCLIMLLMTGPGIWIHLMPPSMKDHIRYFQTTLQRREKGEMDSEVEEYMPEQSGETLALLQQATEPHDDEQREESLIVEEFRFDNDAIGTDDLLAHEEGSTDGLDISEFDLSAPPSLGGSTNGSSNNNRGYNRQSFHQHNYQQSYQMQHDPSSHQKTDLSMDASDSDEDVGDGIRFQSHHFNHDSSEEEEQAFVQGLVFPEPSSGSSTVHTNQQPSASLGEIFSSAAVHTVTQNIANLGTLGSSLISSVIIGAVEKVNAQHNQQAKASQELNRDDSSSSGGESEFEMISHNDLT